MAFDESLIAQIEQPRSIATQASQVTPSAITYQPDRGSFYRPTVAAEKMTEALQIIQQRFPSIPPQTLIRALEMRIYQVANAVVEDIEAELDAPTSHDFDDYSLRDYIRYYNEPQRAA